MDNAAPSVPALDVVSLTGPWAIGFIFSSMLFGIFLVQVWVYIVNFPKDQLGIRILVCVVVTLEFLYTAVSCFVAWDNFGTKWGNPDALLELGWSWSTLTALTGLFASFTQCFFAWRVYKLSKIWFAIPIVALSLMQCFGVLYFDIQNLRQGDSLLGLINFTTYINIWLVGSAVCDILITVAMVTILVRAAAGAGTGHTSHALHKLARLTVETNLVTTVGAIIELILYRTMPDKGYHFLLYLTLGRLYSNVLLASINSRMLFANTRARYVGASESLAPSLWADLRNADEPTRAGISAHADMNKTIPSDHELTVMPSDMESGLFAKGQMV